MYCFGHPLSLHDSLPCCRSRPELAVRLAYSKRGVQDAIEAAGFAEDALLQPTLLAAFPRQMTERFQPTILAHRLRAEIVATELANRMVNRSGTIGRHTSELQSLMRISYAVFCLKTKNSKNTDIT